MYPRRQTRIQNTLRSASLLFLLALGASASGQVATSEPLANDSGVTTLEQDGFSGGVSLNGTYFDIRHQTGKGVGYSNGFTQFGAFAPIWGSDNWFVAPNGRVNLTNDSTSGFNAGLVSRLYSDRFDRIFGVNGYWDNDKSALNHRYDQAGFGLETLGPILDFRANAYIPTTDNSNFIRATGLSPNLVFFGNRLGMVGTQLVESALKGADFEFGVPLSPSTPWLRGYAGMYSYQQDAGEKPVGFRGRVEGWISNDMSVGFMVTHDKQFGTNVNGIIDWRFAGFVPTRYFPSFSTRDRMLMPVQRSWRVTASTYEENVNILADNPRKTAAGTPDASYFVVWVDPDRAPGAAAGVGTYENPFSTLPANVPNQTDLVLVRRGDSTAAMPLNGQINLPHNTRLLGEGFAHILDATATFGGMTQTVNDALLPDAGFRNTGRFPFLSNPAGDIVRVGNGNEVAAFVMNGAAGAAITGTNVRGFNFHHLEISNNGGGGIVLPGAGGMGLVTPDGQTILGGRMADINRNLVNGWANPGGLGNNGGVGHAGIDVSTGISPLDLRLERVSMNATPGGQDYGIRLRGTQGALTALFDDVSTSGGNTVAGTSIEQTTGSVSATINRLQANDNVGIGLSLLTGSQRPMSVVGSNITANRNVGDNLLIGNNPAAPASHNATFNGIFTTSDFSESTAGNGVSLSMSNGIKTLSLTDVLSSGSALSGLDLAATGGTLNFNALRLTANDNVLDNLRIGTPLAPLVGTTFVGNITDSFFNTAQTGSGIVLSQQGGTGTLTALRLTANGNRLDNLQIGTQAAPLVGTTFVGNITDSFFNNAQAGSGIVLSQEAGTGTLNLLNVQTNTNVNGPGLGGDGMGLFGSAATVMNVHNTNGQSNFNSRDGFHVVEVGGANVTLVVDPTLVMNNGRDGLFFDLSGASLLATTFLDDTVTDNVRSAVHGDLNNSTVLLTFDNTIGDRSGDSGFVINATNSSFANLFLTNGTSFVDSGGLPVAGASGVEVNASGGVLGGSTIVLTMDGTPTGNSAIGGTADFGLTARATGVGSNVIVNANAAIFDNARTNAVRALVDAGTATLNLTGTTGNDAGGSGLLATVVNAGTLTLELDNASFLRSGADGLNALVTTNSVFNACIINNSHFDNAMGAGLRIITNGVGPADVLTESNVEMNDSTANGNLLGGVVAQVNTGGDLNFRTIGSFFDGNGTLAGSTDGVFVQADGAGSFARMLFNTTSASDNRGNAAVGVNHGNGFNFEASNGATMTARLDSITATNNMGGYGVRLNATGAGTNALVIPEGTNVINGNTLGSYSINYNGTGFAIVPLTGSFNGQPGDGVHVDIQNVNTALVTLTGNGTDTISDNAGDGVDISIVNAANAGIRIAGYSDISRNMGDGIHIVLSNINTSAAVEVQGLPTLTNLANNADDGVDIALTNVVLGTFMPGALIQLPVLSLNSNDPLNACLPEPTLVPFNTLVTSPTSNGVLLDRLNISRVGVPAVGQNGIDIVGNNVTGTGSITTTNNTITNFNNMVSVALNASSAPVVITDTVVTGNSASGVNVALTNSVGQNVTVTNVRANGNGANGVTVTGNGGTLGNVQLTNVTANNNTLNGINVGLQNLQLTSLLVDGQGTATANGNTLDGVHVALNNVTGVPSLQVGGYAQVNGNGQDGIDVSALATALGLVRLSNNTVNNSVTGNGISLVLNSNVTGPITMDSNVVNMSGLDGIRINLNGVTGGADVSTTNSNINNSGAIGINFTAVGATLGNVLLDPTIVQNSRLDGAHYDFTNATLASYLVDQLTFVNSGRSGAGDGLEVILDGARVAGPVTVSNTNTTVSAGRGVFIHGSGGGAFNALRLGTVNLSNVTATRSTVGEGVLVDFDANAVANGTVGSITLNNVTALNSSLDGIHVDLNTMAVTLGSSITLDGRVAGAGPAVARSNNNGGDGIEVFLNAITGTPNVSIDNYLLVDNNAARGIALLTNGSAVNNVSVSNITGVDRSNGGQGVLIDLTNSDARSLAVSVGTINRSNGRGLDIVLTGVEGGVNPAPAITLNNIAVTNSGLGGATGRGVSVAGVGSAANQMRLGNITLTNVSSNTTGAEEGVAVVLSANAIANGSVGSVALNNVSANLSRTTGILADLNTMTITGATPAVALNGQGTAFSTNNGAAGVGDGIRVNLNAVVGATRAPDVSVNNYLLVDNNAARGIALLTNGSVVNDVSVSNNASVDRSNGGQGVLVNLTNSDVRSLTVAGDTINRSNGRGLDIVLTGVEGGVNPAPAITLNNIAVTNSGLGGATGRGVSVAGVGSAANQMRLGNITLTNVSSNATGAEEGVAVVLSANAVANGSVGSVALNNVSANLSRTTGVLADLNTMTMTGATPVVALNGQGTAFSTNNGVGGVGDGIRVNLNTVVGTTRAPDVSIDNYLLVDNNATRGIALLTNGTAVNNVSVSNNVSVDRSNGGQGVLIDLTNSDVRSLTVAGDTINRSNGRGLDLVLSGVDGGANPAPAITLNNIAVTNSGLGLVTGRGVSVAGVGTAANAMRLGNITLTNVRSGTNGLTDGTDAEEGVAVVLSANAAANGSVGSVTLNNVSATDSRTTGVLVDLNTMTMTGATPAVALNGQGTATSTNNGVGGVGDGIRVNLNTVTGMTRAPDVSIDNYLLVDNNATRGIALLTNGSAVNNVTVSNNASVDRSNGGQGVLIDLTNSDLQSLTVAGDTINRSNGRGLDIVLNGVDGGANPLFPTITLNTVAVTNSGLGLVTGRGVSVAGVGSAANALRLGNITLTDVRSGTNGLGDGTGAEEGVAVVFSANAVANGTVGSIALNNVSAEDSQTIGIRVDLNAVGIRDLVNAASINIDGQGTATSTNNGSALIPGDGIFLNLTNVATLSGPPNVNLNIDNYALIDTNSNNGIALISTATNVGAVSVSNNAAIINSGSAGSGARGVLVNLSGDNVGGVLIDSDVIGNSAGRGLDVVLNNVTGAPVIAISNTTVTNSGARGVSVTGAGAVLGDVQMTFVSSDTTTTEEGVGVVLTGGGTVGSILLNDVSARNSFSDGIVVRLNAMTVGPNITLNGQGNAQVTGNGTDGIWLDLTNLTGAPNLSISDYVQISNNTTGDGIVISQAAGANVGTVGIARNVINNNGTNGVVFQVLASSQATVTLTENQITGHTAGDGVNVVQLGDTDNLMDFDFFRNTITGNSGGRGVNFTLPSAAAPNMVLTADFTNDTVDNNGFEGLLVDLTANATSNVNATIGIHSDAVTANPVSGIFGTSFSNNGRMGVYLNANRQIPTNTASFTLNINGLGSGNVFNLNRDAGVGIDLAGGNPLVPATIGATATATVSNATFSNTTNNAALNPNFNGDGFAVFMRDNSTFNNATLGGAGVVPNTFFTGNTNNGFALTTNGLSKSNALTIQNSTIQGNTGNGLTFLRSANVPFAASYISNVVLNSNTINLNQRGIDIAAQFADGEDTYSITNNTIDSNRRSGIRVFTQADADLRLITVNLNTITNNGTANVAGDREGIVGTQNFAVTDVSVIAAGITNNTIRLNRGAGINVTAVHQLNIGVDLATGAVFGGNTITNNTLDGITITGTSANRASVPVTDQIVQNAINSNGGNGITINSAGSERVNIQNNNTNFLLGAGGIKNNGGDGIQLNGIGSQIVAAVNTNDIVGNTGDGIQFLTSNTGAVANSLSVTGNLVEMSGLRGVNILNAGNTRTNVTISGGNLIDQSQREGVYIVNTSAAGALGVGGAGSQGIDALADSAMATVDASGLADPRLALNVNGNTITSNGAAANDAVLYNATGLVLRVGTSNASNSFTDNGGFASTIANTAAFNALAGNVTTANMARGGVVADITGNTFGGQFGAAVTFEGFVSTNAPAITGGTWTDQNEGDSTAAPPVPRNPVNDAFTVTSYVSDPLSRLDLRFLTNTGNADGLIATRTDVFTSGNAAFYNTNEPLFKSRTQGQDLNDPPVGGGNASNVSVGDDGGPFNSATRRRNAIRQATNIGLAASNAAGNNPGFDANFPRGVGSVVDVANNGFLFPGVGLSTFRTTTNTTGATFNVLPGQGFGSNQPFAGPVTGELPFVWGTIP